MHIVNKANSNFKDAIELLEMYLPHRVDFLPNNKKLSTSEVLGEFWHDFPQQQKNEIDIAIYFLAVFGKIPLTLDNPNAGLEPVFSVNPGPKI